MGLVTFAYALLQQQAVARTAVSDLVRILPALRLANYRHPFQVKVPPLFPINFPPPRHHWWYNSGNELSGSWLPENWLPTALAALAPPANSDLPALHKPLDYDGKGVTQLREAIEQVRTEAAKAILRDTTNGSIDPADELRKVAASTTAHPVLKAAARDELDRIVAAGKK